MSKRLRRESLQKVIEERKVEPKKVKVETKKKESKSSSRSVKIQNASKEMVGTELIAKKSTKNDGLDSNIVIPEESKSTHTTDSHDLLDVLERRFKIIDNVIYNLHKKNEKVLFSRYVIVIKY